MNNLASSRPSEGGQPLAPARALLVLLGIVVLLAGYIGLAYLLQIAAIFAGSLFVFFWVGVEKAAPAAFLPTLVGAFGGIANGGLFHPSLAKAFAIDPGLAALAGLSLLTLAVYMLLIHGAPMLFNQSYMLFATVGAMTQLSDTGIFLSMVECVFLSAAYFGVLLWLFRRFGARFINTAAEAISADDAHLGAAAALPRSRRDHVLPK